MKRASIEQVGKMQCRKIKKHVLVLNIGICEGANLKFKGGYTHESYRY